MHRQEDSHEVEMKMQEGRIRGRRVLPREQEQVIVKGNSEPCHEQATFCVSESQQRRQNCVWEGMSSLELIE
jgi:hypothetical protein